MAEIIGAVIGNRERVLPLGSFWPEGDARLVPEAHGVAFHLLVGIDAVGILVAELPPHDGAAAGHLRLDDLAGLGGYADRHKRTGQPAVRRADVEASVNDVTA